MRNKLTTNLIVKTVSVITLLFVFNSQKVFSEVTVHPAPGDLSTVEHLTQSADYTVKVNGQTSFVYETDNNCYEVPGKRYQDVVAFTSFDFKNEKVTVEVSCNFTVNSVVIKPKSDNVAFTRTGNKITFELSEPKYLKVQINDGKRPLYIFADSSEVAETNAKYYYGPGVHDVGTRFPIDANSTVYIAGGAVVEGTLLLKGPNIKIRGRGILSSGYLEWSAWNAGARNIAMLYDDPSYTGNFNYHEYSGIVMLNSPGWFSNGYGKFRSLLNLKAIGWVRNSDFPHLNGNGIARNCFMFNNDDGLITNTGNNNTYQNCVVDKGPFGRSIVSLNNQSQEYNLWEDVDVIGDEMINGKFGSIAIIESTGGYKRNYIFRNIRIEDGVSPTQPFAYIYADNLDVNNFTFENIIIETTRNKASSITTLNGGTVTGVTFKCIKIAGDYKTSLTDAKVSQSGSGITNITYDNTANCGATALNEISTKNGSVLFPNPATNKVSIKLPEHKISNVSIFDSRGKLILNHSGDEFITSNFTSGLYLVRIKTQDKFFTEKLMVQNLN